ncbi:MAG: thiamine phosphate synthase [Actinomycetota bacterium]
MREGVGQPVSGAAVVCLHQDRVLLVQRDREPNRGRWSFPGGRIEPGETARDAAFREALEETGLRVHVLDVVDVYDAIFPPFHYCVTDYLAVPEDDGDPRPGSDAMDARWVPFSETGAYDLTEAMHQVLERARWMMSVHAEAPPSLGIDLEAVPPAGVEGRKALRDRVRGLYVVTDDALAPGRGHLEIARAALDGGAELIQLRDKRRDAGDLLPLARELQALCESSGPLFIVNDRVDLAVAAGADGVHLGQTDLPVCEARQMLGPGKLIGISVENEEQVLAAAAEGADYLGVGPIYGTATKSDAGDAVGTEQLVRFREISELPIVAIGGVTAARVPEALAAGADAVAVISAVVKAEDMTAAAGAFSQIIARSGS